MILLEQKYKAPEIYGEHWFNSDPIIISANRGFVIYVDFWDATDQGSIRGLPYVKEWYKRYSDYGVIFISVHSPKFQFGKEFDFIQNAVLRLDLKYPTVTDNEHYLRSLFKVRILPTRILIDRSGYIRYIHEGEGFYQSLEIALQTLLIDAGFHGDLPEIMEPLKEEDRQGVRCYKCTPEVLVGYQRSSIGNTDGYFPQSVYRYKDPKLYLEGRVYLNGLWLVDKDYVKSENSGLENNYLLVYYRGKEVNTVLEPDKQKSVRVYINQDEEFITKGIAGSSIQFDDKNRSFIEVNEPGFYHLIKNYEFGEHIIKLFTIDEDFKFYSISFVSAPISELRLEVENGVQFL